MSSLKKIRCVRTSTLKKEQCTDTRNSIGYISIYIKNSEEQRAVPHIYRYITNAISCVYALFFFKCTSPNTGRKAISDSGEVFSARVGVEGAEGA